MTIPDFDSTFAAGPVGPEADPKRFYRQAYWLAHCASIVYSLPNRDPGSPITPLIDAWTAKERYAYIDSEGSTECFVAGDDDVIIVSFRGTEVRSFWDILADLVVFPTRDAAFEGKVHLGFNNALNAVWEPYESSVPKVIEDFRDKGQKVWLTGHSLGGALATLAAARVLKEGRLAPDDIGGVITFGQPRVGDPEFATTYDDVPNGLEKRHFRFVNNNDVVTRVPTPIFFKWRFSHVGRVVFVNRKGELEAGVGSIPLAFRRIGSRFGALTASDGGALGRFLPGGTDHGMANYLLALDAHVGRG